MAPKRWTERTAYDALRDVPDIKVMSQRADEREHSLELHFPWLRKVFEEKRVQIVPVTVGRLTKAQQRKWAETIEPYISDPRTLLVVSTDFCHWCVTDAARTDT